MTPRFIPEDERTYTLLPKGRYPAKVARVYKAERPDSEGRTFYKLEVSVLKKEFEGIRATVNMSEHWMRHLLIHIMRAVGMMDVMVVDPFFRGDPEDSASFSMATVMGNLTDCLVGIEIVHQDVIKDNEKKTYHNVKDFMRIKKKDKSLYKQPDWKEVASSNEPPSEEELGEDIVLEEDDDEFLMDA
jgi:hypothetical protein